MIPTLSILLGLALIALAVQTYRLHVAEQYIDELEAEQAPLDTEFPE